MNDETFAQIHEAFLKSYHGEEDFEFVEKEIAYSPKSKEYKDLKNKVEEILGDAIQQGRVGLLGEDEEKKEGIKQARKKG